jgi:uncharacterized membrane protein YdjX (TVP38/TMEM64 family)
MLYSILPPWATVRRDVSDIDLDDYRIAWYVVLVIVIIALCVIAIVGMMIYCGTKGMSFGVYRQDGAWYSVGCH